MSRKISKNSLGRKAEKKCIERLGIHGWLTERKLKVKYHSPDFFGMFDAMAIKGSVTRYIQVKSNKSDFYSARKKIKKWLKENRLYLYCEVWLYNNDSDTWRIDKFCK